MFAGNSFSQDRKEPADLGVADDGYLRLVIYVVKTLKCFLCLFVATAFFVECLGLFYTFFFSQRNERHTANHQPTWTQGPIPRFFNRQRQVPHSCWSLAN